MWKIEILPLYDCAVPGPEVFFQRGFGTMEEIAIHAFLLHGPATVLVDTGLPADHAALNAAIRARKGPASGFRPRGPRLETTLAARGIRPDAILLTSFGPYAAGGLPGLAGIPVHASARGLADLSAPEEPALVHPLPPEVRAAVEAARPVTGEAEILPGLALMEVGVHHPASAAVIVQTPEGRVAIADPVFTTRNLTEGVALGAAEEAGLWHRLVDDLAERSEALLPIHDPDPRPVPRDTWRPRKDRR